jgi:hypothetical protein
MNNTTFKTFFKKQITGKLIYESHHIDTAFFNELCDRIEQKFNIDVTHPDSVSLHKVQIEDLRKEANMYMDSLHHYINDTTEEAFMKLLNCETPHEFMIRLLSNTM